MGKRYSDLDRLDRAFRRILRLNQRLFQASGNDLWTLDNSSGNSSKWQLFPRGIYIFADSTVGSRLIYESIVRVGTHSIKKGGSKSTLWGRLRQHRGNVTNGGGNHRGSIFRLLVGDAIIRRENIYNQFPDWGIKRNASKAVRDSELLMEQRVSEYIRQFPFLVLKVDPTIDGPNHRAYLERNLIAILSSVGYKRESDWLGSFSSRQEVCNSGLWNNNHVNEKYDPNFLDLLERYVNEMGN